MPSQKTLKEVVGHWGPRFWVAGVDPNDLEILLQDITDWDDWLRKWSNLGDFHYQLGEEALADGNNLTAAEAYVRAAMYYHFGQFMFFHYPEEKKAAIIKRVNAYAKGAPYFSVPAVAVEIPFENTTLPAYLRIVDSSKPGPCVIVLPGADSSKEQIHTLENSFLAREISTLGMDGPGQGITRYQMPMRQDYYKAVNAAIDYLVHCGKVDPEQISIVGTSFGGFLALQAACFEPRLKSAACVGGFYDFSGWDNYSSLMKTNFTFLFGKDNWDEAKEFSQGLTLKGILQQVKCPLLVVHGKLDKIAPVETLQKIKEETATEVELVIYDQGNHVCNNIAYLYRPLIADWTKKKLTSERVIKKSGNQVNDIFGGS